MARLIDLWRISDAEATWVSGDRARITDPVRAVARSRASNPRIPEIPAGTLLIVDASHLHGPADALLGDLAAADIRPAAVIVGACRSTLDGSRQATPLLASSRPTPFLAQATDAYLADEAQVLASAVGDLRLAAAERALADPDPVAVATLGASRLRRGIAVSVDGHLVAVVPRPAGRALAARFVATHTRTLAESAGRGGHARTVNGLVTFEQRIRSGAALWLFDDLPLSRLDLAAAGALAITLRALLRRQTAIHPATLPVPSVTTVSDSLAATLLAVARSNGRIAPAARALGVHRNTVLYRLKVAKRDHGVDPRQAPDAIRILRDADWQA